LVDNVFLKLVIKNVEERKKEGERELQISDFLSEIFFPIRILIERYVSNNKLFPAAELFFDKTDFLSRLSLPARDMI